MKNVFQKCVLGVGLAALMTASSLSATGFWSEKVAIPFDFKVSKMTLPAGEYRVQQAVGSDITYLQNVNTGQQVQFLRNYGNKNGNRTRLVFETANGEHVLKSIS